MTEDLLEKVVKIRNISPEEFAKLHLEGSVELFVLDGKGDDYKKKASELKLLRAAATNQQLIASALYELKNVVDSDKVRDFVELMGDFFQYRKRHARALSVTIEDKDLTVAELTVIGTEHFFELNKEREPWYRHRK